MEILSSIQKSLLLTFGRVSDSGQFYLTGGTALAYFYLQHRKSNDLNFFTSLQEIVTPFSHRLEETLRAQGMSVTRQRGVHSFVELAVKQGTEATVIHLAQDAPFRFEPPQEFPEFPGLKVDSLEDIASNKLLALFGRATLRDFVAVYFLIQKAGFTKKTLTEKAQKKDPGFDLYWLGVAFERLKTFQKGATELHALTVSIDFHELSRFFDEWRKAIVADL